MSENAENVTEYCLNCKHDVPAGNIQMHIIHCQRNIQLCPVCDERILRSELENHTKEFHSVISCKECDAKLESSELDEHKSGSCGKRIVACQYCDLELKADDIDEHEDYCGSRTECCEGCGKLIMLKFQHLHLDSNHKFTKLNEVEITDSDDEDLVMWEKDRNYASPRYKRRSTRQRHLRFPNAGPSANTTPSGLNGHKQKKMKSQLYEETSELNEYFRNLNLENGHITNGTTAEINEIINRERSPLNPNHAWLQDHTLIPCEFCKVPIVADNLVLHQTGCRPDLSSVQSSSEKPQQSYVRNLRNEGFTQIDTDSDDDLQFMRQVLGPDEAVIPCEFCLQHFSLDDISSHQYVCRRNNYVL